MKHPGIFLFVFYTVFMLSIWCIDISVTAINLGLVMTNGFIFKNPAQTYHLGLYTALLSGFLLGLLLLAKDEKPEAP